MDISNPQFRESIIEANGQIIRPKMIPIGDWNMDNTHFCAVNETIPTANIRSFSAIIRNNAGTLVYPINYVNIDPGFGTVSDDISGSIYWDGVNNWYLLNRVVGRFFDDVNFNAIPYNRGWVKVWYVI